MISDLQTDLFSRLAVPFTGELLFDRLGDIVYFVKNGKGEYVVVNQTLVDRCGRRAKSELIGRRADELFPPPFGQRYSEQDDRVVQTGEAILDQLKLHYFPAGNHGWCLTNKLPLFDRHHNAIGLVGVSKDLQVANERTDEYSRVAKVIEYMRSNFGEPLRVMELASQAGLSPYQFEQRLRRIFGLTVGQLIQKIRMENAIAQLRETNAGIASVALACGYSDQSAFTRQFRATTGFSPSVYREMCRPKNGL